MITVNEVIRLHDLAIKFFGGIAGIRDMNLLESAVNRPFQTFEGADLYITVYEKCAALLESIVKNHPFIDGNKRTGFLVIFVMLGRNKIKLIASEFEIYDLLMNIASSKLSFDTIVKNLQEYSTTKIK